MSRSILHYTLLSAPLLVLLACSGRTQSEGIGSGGGSGGSGGSDGGSAAPGTSDAGASVTGGSGGSGAPSEPVSVARGPACDFYPCMSACGQRVALAPVEAHFGFSATGISSNMVSSSTALGSDAVLTTTEEAVVRSSIDFSVLGRTPVAGGAYRSAVVGGWALAQGQYPGVALLDVSSPTNPKGHSWWFDAGEGEPRGVGLVGASQGLFVLRTQGGLSFVEVTDAGPREAFCFEQPGSVGWGVMELSGDVLAIAEGEPQANPSVVRLYRVSGSGMSAWATYPTEVSLPFISVSGRLGIRSDVARQLTLYDVTEAEPRRIATVEGLPQSSNYNRAIGGFDIRGDNDEVAVDLQGNLELYDLTRIDGSECLWRVTPRAGGEAFIISPVVPERRLPATPVPSVSCPALSQPTVGTLALSPDGNTVLRVSQSDETWVFHDLRTGAELSSPRGVSGQSVHWVRDRLVFVKTEGSDYDITIESQLSVVSASEPDVLLATVASPGPFITVRATSQEVWALTYAENYVYGERPPRARRLWRLDPAADAPAPVMLTAVVDDVRTFEVVGDRVYLVSADSVRVTDRDGNTIQQLQLPAPVTSTAASELGLFIADRASDVWRLAPEASTFVTVVQDCAGCTLLGANASRFYLDALAPRDARHTLLPDWDESLAYSELHAYSLQTSAPVLVGRYPTPHMSEYRLVSTEGTVAFINANFLLEEQPSP